MALQITTDPSENSICQYYTGLKPDRPDPRDFERVYGTGEIPPTDTHLVVDLRKYIKQVFTQGNMNSCAANVVCAAYELLLEKQAENADFAYYHFYSSRLFVYYNSRTYNFSTKIDDGATIRDTLKGIQFLGTCREFEWPYVIEKLTRRPPQSCFDKAKGNTVCKYEYLRQDINQLRACLKAGFPIAFGFRMYRSFRTMQNGQMPMPSNDEIQNTPNPDLHGVLAVGFDDDAKRVTVMNSWGEAWGDKGYFYMPYNYIADPNRAFNFWKIEHACEKFEIEIQPLP